MILRPLLWQLDDSAVSFLDGPAAELEPWLSGGVGVMARNRLGNSFGMSNKSVICAEGVDTGTFAIISRYFQSIAGRNNIEGRCP